MTNIDKLLEVQNFDLKIARIEKEIHDIPIRKDEELTRMESHQKALDEANKALQEKESEIRQQELEVESCQEKIKKLRQQQMTLKTNKEFKAVETEIDILNDKIKGFEDQELEMMEALELLRRDVKTKEAELAEEKKFIDEDIALLDKRLSELEESLVEEKQKRELATKDVDKEWLERYEIILSRKGNAVVKLEDGICSGCHMKLPPSAVQNVRKSNQMTFCDFCGRLLF